jgi:hypothetical protein
MPDQPKTNNAEHNAEIAAKVAAQDAAGQSLAPAASPDTSVALDDLLKAANEKKAADAEAALEVEPKPGDEPKPDGDPKPGDEPKAGDEPPVKPAATPPVTPPKDDAAEKRAAELFKDSPGLPAGASPKSSEAFLSVKTRAAQEISKLEQQLADLTKANSEFSEKLKNPVPAEVTKELEDLRQFRARLDVDLDPKFKEYDKAVTSAQDFIYSQLKKSPAVTDETIAQIKKYGGPENVNMTKIFEVIKDPTIQRLVETKIADIEQQKFNKEQAIKSVKENIGQYLSEREQSFKQSAVSHTTATKTELNQLLPKVEWLTEKTAPAGADDATVKSVKEHNEFVATTRKQLDEALADDSPQMRAIMLVGMAQLFNLQKVNAAQKVGMESLQKKLDDANKLIERLKSPSRSRESGAPTNRPEPVKTKDNFNISAGDSLDSLRKQVIETRQKAAAGV